MMLDDLGAILAANSIGALGVNLVLGRAPEEPHDLVAVVPYGGLVAERTHSGTDRRWPRVQVLCRAMDPQAAYAKAEAVRVVFRAVGQFEVGGLVYEAILPISEPMALLVDTHGRTPVTVNYEVRWHYG